MTQTNLTPWLTNTFRLTAFANVAVQVNSDGWWETVMGEKPESIQFRPRERVSRQEGPFGDGRLLLNVQPGRVDWVWIAFESAFSLGQFPLRLIEFRQKMEPWLINAPKLKRIAFGAVLLQPTENIVEGNETITQYLPNVRLQPDEVTDFVYQVNRPRQSLTLGEAKAINRLSKWSVSNVVTQSMLFSTDAELLENSSTESFWACRLELDISTPAETSADLPHDQLNAVFSELIQVGTEIAVSGDV